MNYTELTKKIYNKEYETKLPYPMYEDKKKTEDEIIKDREKLKAYYEDDRRLRQEFEKDCYVYASEKLAISNYPAFKFVFDEAYEVGHSEGYLGVLNYLDNYLDMIKRYIK